MKQSTEADPPAGGRGPTGTRPVSVLQDDRIATDPFRHEAMLYKGMDEFCAGTLPFIRGAVTNDEPVLVVVNARKIALLRSHLGGDADKVHFADMADVGLNPARIIPAWHDFVSDQSVGRPVRGIGEPIWAARSPAEMIECHYHESLLNLAFRDVPSFWLLCPYDTGALEPDVLDWAACNHPHVLDGVSTHSSSTYRSVDDRTVTFDAPLPLPRAEEERLGFDLTTLRTLRLLVTDAARRAGLDEARTADFTLAVHEVATNSVRHGGGAGVLSIWTEGRTLMCDIEDHGRLDRPLVGRERPDVEQIGGRGLWIVNQICDLVQLRSFPSGTVIRLHLRLD